MSYHLGRPVPVNDGRPVPPNYGRPVPPNYGSVPPNYGNPVPPNDGRPVPPNDGRPMPPNDGRPVPPNDDNPVPPNDGRPVPPNDGRPVPPNYGRPVPANYGRPVPPNDGRPVPGNYDNRVPPNYGRPVPPNYGRPVPGNYGNPLPPNDSRLVPGNYGNPLPPNEGRPVPPNDGNPVPPNDGRPVPPNDGNPVPPNDGRLVPGNYGNPVPPNDGRPVPPNDGRPVPPNDGRPVPPNYGNPVPPNDGRPVPPNDGRPVPPNDGRPVPPNDGRPVPPNDGRPVPPNDGKPLPGNYDLPLQHNYDLPLQHNYDLPLQHNYDLSLQHNYDLPLQHNYDLPLQHNYDLPVQHNYGLPLQHNYDLPVQHNYGFQVPHNHALPVQHNYDSPVQHNYDSPVQHNYDSPVQHNYGLPVQHNYGLPVQHNYDLPVQHNYGLPVQHNYGLPLQHNYGLPLQHNYDLPVQHNYSLPLQHNYDLPVQHNCDLPVQHNRNWPMSNTYGRPAVSASPITANLNRPSQAPAARPLTGRRGPATSTTVSNTYGRPVSASLTTANLNRPPPAPASRAIIGHQEKFKELPLSRGLGGPRPMTPITDPATIVLPHPLQTNGYIIIRPSIHKRKPVDLHDPSLPVKFDVKTTFSDKIVPSPQFDPLPPLKVKRDTEVPPIVTLVDLLRTWSWIIPDRIAFVFCSEIMTVGRVKKIITWSELYDLGRLFAYELKQFGLKRGDRVINTLVSSPERLVCEAGILLAGGVSVGSYYEHTDSFDFSKMQDETYKPNLLDLEDSLQLLNDTAAPFLILNREINWIVYEELRKMDFEQPNPDFPYLKKVIWVERFYLENLSEQSTRYEIDNIGSGDVCLIQRTRCKQGPVTPTVTKTHRTLLEEYFPKLFCHTTSQVTVGYMLRMQHCNDFFAGNAATYMAGQFQCDIFLNCAACTLLDDFEIQCSDLLFFRNPHCILQILVEARLHTVVFESSFFGQNATLIGQWKQWLPFELKYVCLEGGLITIHMVQQALKLASTVLVCYRRTELAGLVARRVYTRDTPLPVNLTDYVGLELRPGVQVKIMSLNATNTECCMGDTGYICLKHADMVTLSTIDDLGTSVNCVTDDGYLVTNDRGYGLDGFLVVTFKDKHATEVKRCLAEMVETGRIMD